MRSATSWRPSLRPANVRVMRVLPVDASQPRGPTGDAPGVFRQSGGAAVHTLRSPAQRAGPGERAHSHEPLERVPEVVPPRSLVPVGEEVLAPREPLVRDGAELPDAERRAVRAVERPRMELRVVVAVLRPHRLPELVVVLPRRYEEEMESGAAPVEDHEPERLSQPELAQAHRIREPASSERAHVLGDRLL